MPALTDLCLSVFSHIAPGDVWRAWSLAPPIVIVLLGMLGLYALGYRSLTARGAQLHGPSLSFAAGWLFLVVALVSPLCRLSAGLASAHMVQHVILVGIAPPLLLLGSMTEVIAAAGGKRWQGLIARVTDISTMASRSMGGLAAIIAAYGIAIWLWHSPRVYDAILASPAIHLFGYAALVVVSLMFWSAILTLGKGGTAGAGAAAIALLVTTIHTGLLGALLTLSPFTWFASATAGPLWGLQPIEDQQLAGLIMWAPMAGIYLAACLALLYRALAQGSDTRLLEG